ncbi:glycosyltransferase 87 family protein [Kutzneria sp. CA-103260]|uniref:glycosyltransferase 87 family protein n=1 Tax=Kutzneria sp. CA-103260 TaxID=2802641 RepID=UPI001BA44772|nr:glycosyltransferase 87 family protein [Kutzneria sp. CA-103260]QUQ62402.1 membrane protein [Kutzneria sp. CA-103260]
MHTELLTEPRIEPSAEKTPLVERLARHALAPAGVYLAVRVVGVAILGVLAAVHDRNLLDVLKAWDGEWYLSIARDGYATAGLGKVDAAGNFTPDTTMAFFPGYPLVIGMLGRLTSTALPLVGVAASLIAGLAAAYGIARLPRDRKVGLITVALFAATPMAVTLSMVYSEALFSALAVWTLVGVMERRWWLAALCCAAAGLVRPSAGVLIVIVIVAVIMYGRTASAWLAAAICPLGLVGFLAWVANRTGSLTGWFEVQKAGWGTAFDFGANTWQFIRYVLTRDTSVMETTNMFVVLGAIVLCVLAVLRKQPWPLVAYGIGLVVMTAGSSGVTYSKMRLLVPACTLLIPVAIGLARRRNGTVLAVLVASALVSGWIGAYALTAWKYAI